MGNSKSSLQTGHFFVDLSNKQGIKGSFWDFLSHDNDMTENEDYFQEDTMELGYEDEAHRQIEEITKYRKMDTRKSFENAWKKIFDLIESQEYYCACEYDIIDLDDKLLVTYAIGGRTSWCR